MGVAAEARVPLVSRSWLRVEALVGAALDLVLDPPSVVWRAGGGNGTASWALSSWEPHATIALRLVTGRDLP